MRENEERMRVNQERMVAEMRVAVESELRERYEREMREAQEAKDERMLQEQVCATISSWVVNGGTRNGRNCHIKTRL